MESESQRNVSSFLSLLLDWDIEVSRARAIIRVIIAGLQISCKGKGKSVLQMPRSQTQIPQFAIPNRIHINDLVQIC